MPVYGTMASRFNDDGVTALYQAIAAEACRTRASSCTHGKLPPVAVKASSRGRAIVPPERSALSRRDRRAVRDYHMSHSRSQARTARERQALQDRAAHCSRTPARRCCATSTS